ncbi:cytochrome c oxidase assembly protein [Haematobacter massiliensis]|uniref:Membrane protein n=1 Tax=Haematobacter massiliensis TaxID=195105 RepID=A0A086Y8B3_9RHOB|nr:cytochrome c oxidase assembly protein [Haematobacter massiliensis]KFI30513.1 membrane protein [Haematobacter massiliensis]OWJ69311.1 cytochrome c oxidase assembly protein [Haematobacter massiliensis]OWJ81240.1 cytochrome c oxidase assembly protein [Haematobacter massiliensis]QBJ24983.1 cytochrome c oxidase assembly protein [Haematobacter massiliensis]
MEGPAMTPYCGPAPAPEALWLSWNLDPLVLVPILLLAMWSLHARSRAGIVAAGVLFIAFVSPLCALSTALFSARVAHHVLLVSIAAPLLARCLPRGPSRGAELAFLAHAATLWLWHTPGPYGWALSSPAAYWLMEATLLGSAVWLWRAMLSPATAAGRAILLLLGVTMQMGLLGALLVFAGRPLFADHLATTAAYDLSPLEDQQLAGLIMWVPAALPYLGVALWRLSGLLAPDRRSA